MCSKASSVWLMSALSSPGHTWCIQSCKRSNWQQTCNHIHPIWMICLLPLSVLPCRVISAIVFITVLHVMKHLVELIKKKPLRVRHVITRLQWWKDLLSDLQWLTSHHVKTSLVLTCWVHDVVYQVCEPGRGLVRQQVGEKIPGARQRQHIQSDRKKTGPIT